MKAKSRSIPDDPVDFLGDSIDAGDIVAYVKKNELHISVIEKINPKTVTVKHHPYKDNRFTPVTSTIRFNDVIRVTDNPSALMKILEQ